MKKISLLCLLWCCALPVWAAQVSELKITVLSTMLTEGTGLGEWGYAALVEVDGRKLLFDTGARPDTVLSNARELGIDLADVEDVILSHHHGDHTGGLLTLRNAFKSSNPAALSRVHIAAGFFSLEGSTRGNLVARRVEWEAAGITFIEHESRVELLPGVWLTGPVPRHTDEANYPPNNVIRLPDGSVPDNIPDDQALVFATADGIIVLTGCGHAGVINLVDYARELSGVQTLHAVIGGLHIFDATEERIVWTGEQLKAGGVRYLLLGHCTGVESTLRLREVVGLDRSSAGYGAIGSTYEHGVGIDAGRL